MAEHGGRIYHYNKEILDFSANIHPDGVPEEIMAALHQAMKEIVHYPDPDCIRLRKAIGQKHAIDPEMIICGNGAADLIFHLAFVLKAKKILLPVPTFVEYEEAFSAIEEDVQFVYFQMNTESFHIEKDILSDMKDSVDVLVLCNPNNPTGQRIEPELLTQILEKAKKHNIFVLLDECFLDFVVDGQKYSKISEIGKYNNLLILRSFTKMYGIPGIRLGYAITSNAKLRERMKKSMQSWSVSHLAQEAGIAACKLMDYEKKTAEQIASEQKYLTEQLRKLKLRVWEGTANFVFFQKPGCINLSELCIQYGICIRHCHNYQNLGLDYYRVAVKNRKENEKLIDVLGTIIEENDL